MQRICFCMYWYIPVHQVHILPGVFGPQNIPFNMFFTEEAFLNLKSGLCLLEDLVDEDDDDDIELLYEQNCVSEHEELDRQCFQHVPCFGSCGLSEGVGRK